MVQNGSPAIDGGLHLTTTQNNGDGNLIRVRDARYFVDGFGIPGEQGDMIIVGNNEPVRIIAVDYGRNELMVGRNISWQADAGVSLTYEGNGPDIGAQEIYALRNSDSPAPPPPSRVSSGPRPLPPTITSVL